MQLTIDFETSSPINIEKLRGQNRKLYEMLLRGSVTMIDAMNNGIMCCHSRISDLRNVNGITIHDRYVKRNGVSMKEYSLGK